MAGHIKTENKGGSMNSSYYFSTVEGAAMIVGGLVWMYLFIGALAFKKYRVAGLVGLLVYLFCDLIFMKIAVHPNFPPFAPPGTHLIAIMLLILCLWMTFITASMVVKQKP